MPLCPLRDAGAIARFAGAVAVAVLVAACATTPKYGPDSPVTTVVVPVERLQYPPLVPKLPITVGIYYSPEFREAVVSAGGGDTPRYRYEIGAAAVALFDQNASALFARTVALSSAPGRAGNAAGLDLVLSPGFNSRSTFFWLALDVLAPDGSSITRPATFPIELPAPDNWTTATHSQSLSVASRVLRDGLGNLFSAVVLSPDVANWANARGAAWVWADAPPPVFGAKPTDGVSILVCSFNLSCRETEDAVAVADALRKLDARIRIVRGDELRQAVYPWLGFTPLATDSQVAEWLRRSAVASRAAAVGVRYLVIVDDFVTGTTGHGGILCGGGMGGGGCFGLWWETRNESARLRVFDFASAVDAGDVNHQREDVSWVIPALGLPLPIPIPRGGDSMPDAIAKQLLPLVRPPK